MAQPQRNAPLLEQITANPLLIDSNAESLFQASVSHVVTSEHASELLNAAASSDAGFWPQPDEWEARYRPYNVKDGVLQIPIMGVLLHRFPFQFGRWATGYKYIEQAVRRGREDDNVKKIALICDSPGGEVAGCFELVDEISEGRSVKPIWAFAADHSYSAAYALASAASKVIVTRSGGVGSVGVVTAHFDYSGALEQMGVKVTFIYKGKHKVDGNAYEKLSADAKARIDKRIDKLYGVFTSTVAKNRGMEEQAVRDTEALTYDANDGIAVGFADRLGALDDELAIFADDDDATSEGDEEMADVKQDVHEKAVADARAEGLATGRAEGKTEGKTEGLKEGATAEKTRVTAILDSDEGKKRPKAALAATKTSMSAEEAVAFLAGLAEETAPAAAAAAPAPSGQSHFDVAMSKDVPNVGGNPTSKTESTETDAVSSILGAYGNATGIKPKAA